MADFKPLADTEFDRIICDKFRQVAEEYNLEGGYEGYASGRNIMKNNDCTIEMSLVEGFGHVLLVNSTNDALDDMIRHGCFKGVSNIYYRNTDKKNPTADILACIENFPSVKLPTTLDELETAISNASQSSNGIFLLEKLRNVVPKFYERDKFVRIVDAMRDDPMKFVNVDTLNLSYFAKQALNSDDAELWNPTDAEMQDIVDRSGASKPLAESVMKAFRLLR